MMQVTVMTVTPTVEATPTTALHTRVESTTALSITRGMGDPATTVLTLESMGRVTATTQSSTTITTTTTRLSTLLSLKRWVPEHVA